MSETAWITPADTGMEAVELRPDRPHRFSDPRLDGVYRYWNRQRAGRAAPARADIDPLDLPPRVLPYVSLLDVLPGPPRDYRIRLVGTAVVRFWGEDTTGRSVRAVVADTPAEAIVSEYDRVVDTWLPHHAARPSDWLNPEHARYERLALPLSSDGRRVDMLLTVLALH